MQSDERLRASLFISIAILTGAFPFLAEAQGAVVPRDVKQLVVAVAPDWDSHGVRLQCFERGRKTWKPVFAAPIPALVGRSGLAWGRGVHRIPEGSTAPLKRERDGRAPAGVFALGRVFGYAPQLPEGAEYNYRQVTEWDAWVDDSSSEFYNRHVVVDPQKVPEWFEKQRMRHGDFAYRWLLEIRHNADPPVPGAGSAIFFHIRRGEDRPTAGCTTMRESDLVAIIRWLRVKSKPHYVLLPQGEYERFREEWGLPELR